MPRPKESEPLQKVKTNLYESDYEWLKKAYPLQGPARVIRALVRAYRRKVESQINPAAALEIDFQLEEDELGELT